MKTIILLGPKHCGKTSVAKALGEYVDLDEEIQKTTGKTPRQLYTEGAEIFQKAEVDSLRCANLRFDAAVRGILSTGGGIIDNNEAVEVLKNMDAVKVYLNISAAAAWQRISAADELPPFLQTDNPQETHRALHERRTAAYRQLADIIIEADGKTPNVIAEEIAAKTA